MVAEALVEEHENIYFCVIMSNFMTKKFNKFKQDYQDNNLNTLKKDVIYWLKLRSISRTNLMKEFFIPI